MTDSEFTSEQTTDNSASEQKGAMYRRALPRPEWPDEGEALTRLDGHECVLLKTDMRRTHPILVRNFHGIGRDTWMHTRGFLETSEATDHMVIE